MSQQALMQLGPLVLLFVMLYAFMILPEKKKRKKYQEMIENIKLGDKIMTRGGIYGKITNIDSKNDIIVVESGPDRMRITMAKNAISTIVEPSEEDKKVSKKNDKKENQSEVEFKENPEVAADTAKKEEKTE